MRAVKVFVVLTFAMLFVYAQVESRESGKTRVLSLENAWNEAEKHKDAKAIEGLLAPTFAYTDSDGKFQNKEQYLEGITAASYHPEQIVNESMDAQTYEKAVVVTGMYREKGADKGKAYVRRGRFTDMWVQEKSAWLCAASHETLIGK